MTNETSDDLSNSASPRSVRTSLSRRGVLAAAAGGVAAGGLGLATAGSAAAAGEVDGAVGVGPRGTTTVEFRGRIDQTGDTGELFTSYGYLTRVTKTEQSQLFDGTPYNE